MKKTILALCLAAFMLPNMYGKKTVTLFLVGDETMAELTQPEDMTDSAAVGWGQELQSFLANTVVLNYAAEGETTRTLLTSSKWNDVLSQAKCRNIMLIQFGHHEYDETDPRVYSTLEEFENNLLQMVEEAQKKRIKVVLLTPTVKRFFYDGEYIPRHGAYAEGVRRVAQRMEVPLVDLEVLTRSFMEKRGSEGSKAFYAAGDDAIRFNQEGAKTVAKMVVQAAKEQKIKGLYTK